MSERYMFEGVQMMGSEDLWISDKAGWRSANGARKKLLAFFFSSSPGLQHPNPPAGCADGVVGAGLQGLVRGYRSQQVPSPSSHRRDS